jgi:uncharacterized membrane protein YfcA
MFSGMFASPFAVALARGVVISLITGVVACLTLYQQMEVKNWEEAIIVGVVTGLTGFLGRGVLEGGIDASRAPAQGDVGRAP